MWILEALAGLGALCGAAYYLLCLGSARSFLRGITRPPYRRDSAAPPFTPPVSILKPLRGTDPEIYESFRSHCLQDYPEYEMIFGVSEADDPAVALVERLRQEFPHRAIQLVVCPKILGANVKVSNLVQMLPLARYDYLIVNDSDIRVPRDYLQRVAALLRDPQAGMVTCLYRGVPTRTLGSHLEAIGISTDFCAGVLAARQIEGVRFALGSTLAFPRKALDAIGGFDPLVDYLADDFQLGARIADAGFKVLLSEVIVDHYLPAYSLGGFLQHQLRWARSTRDSRPRGYAGMVLTFGLPWAILAAVLSEGADWTWALLALVAALRLAMALVMAGRVLHDPRILRQLWLIPLRDVAAVLVWLGSYTGHTVAWRGDQFILEKGKLRPA